MFFSLLSRLPLKTMVKVTLFSLLLVSCISIGHTPKASADCDINSGNLGDYAGLVANVIAVKPDGTRDTTSGIVSNTSMSVVTSGASYTSGGNIVGIGNTSNRQQNMNFTTVSNKATYGNCGGYDTGVILGGDNATPSDNGTGTYELDCDHSRRATTAEGGDPNVQGGDGHAPNDIFQHFRVWMNGTATGHTGRWVATSYTQTSPADASFNSSNPSIVTGSQDPVTQSNAIDINPPNGRTTYIVFEFVEDAPPAQPASGGVTNCIANQTNITITFSYDNAVAANGAKINRNNSTLYDKNSQVPANSGTYPLAGTSGGGNLDGGSGLQQGVDYTYSIQVGGVVQPTTATCRLAPPSGTNGVACSVTSSTTVSLSFSWTGITTNNGVDVKRGTPATTNTNGLPVAAHGTGAMGSSNTGSDSGLTAGTTYRYFLVGNGGQTLATSNDCTFTPQTCNNCDPGCAQQDNCTPQCNTCTCTDSCPVTGHGTFSCTEETGTSITITYSYSGTVLGVRLLYQKEPDDTPAVAVRDNNTSEMDATQTFTGLVPGSTYEIQQIDAQYGTSYGALQYCDTTNTPPVTFTLTGNAGVNLDSDEAPTSYTSSGGFSVSPGSPTATGLSCSITVSLKRGATGVTTSTTSPTAPCTAGSNNVTGPNGPTTAVAGDVYCATITVIPGSGTLNGDGSVSDPGAAYTSQPSCVPVANKPFFKVLDSSVSTGGDVTGDGSCTADAGVLAGWFNNTDANHGYGSSAQLSAYALAHINGFGSNQTPNSGVRYPSELSFANTPYSSITTSKNSPYLGGNFGGDTTVTNCLTTPATDADGQNDVTAGDTSIDLSSPTFSGNYHHTYNGSVTITGSTIATGSNVALFVTGDVLIKGGAGGGINYASGVWTLANMPSFVLSVKGNIYISQEVTHLDGVYEAEKNGATGGTIFTCAITQNPPFSQAPQNRLYDSCNKQLVVSGSFLAHTVDLMRTYGTLSDESSAVPPTGCANSGGAIFAPVGGQVNTCAAEIFQFSPEQYLEQPSVQKPGNGVVQYDAITSLPPVL